MQCHVNISNVLCKMDQHKLVGTQSKKLKEDVLVEFDREKCGLENGV